MKTIYFLIIAFAFCFSFMACEKESIMIDETTLTTTSTSDNQAPASHETADILNVLEGTIDGEATLWRTDSNVKMSFTVDGLMPGHSYTAWWVIYNKPENCATSCECRESDFANFDSVEIDVLYAAGQEIDESGVGNFSDVLNIGDDDGSVNERDYGMPSFGGLQDTRIAEIHLVLRSDMPHFEGNCGDYMAIFPGGCGK